MSLIKTRFGKVEVRRGVLAGVHVFRPMYLSMFGGNASTEQLKMFVKEEKEMHG